MTFDQNPKLNFHSRRERVFEGPGVGGFLILQRNNKAISVAGVSVCVSVEK